MGEEGEEVMEALLIPSVFGLCGLLLGWVVRDLLGRKKLDPNLIRAANEQIEAVRQDLGDQLGRVHEEREKDRQAFGQLLVHHSGRADHWMNQALGKTPSGAPPVEVPPERSPPPEAPEDIESDYRLATEGAEGGPSEVRQSLLDKGLTADEADAILKGEYGDLPPGERMDLFVKESIQDATGLA